MSNTACPNCLEAMRESGDACEGWLFQSMDYPELLHCNCCGFYYRRKSGVLNWIPKASLSAWREVRLS